MINYLPPVDKGIQRPIISVIIPTYNNGVYLRRSIESVLSQEYSFPDIEIEVVDDCSSDNTTDIVKSYNRFGVKYFKQTKNVKHVRNFETGLRRSTGLYTHLLHGDDMVRPGFYSSALYFIKKYPQVGAFFCRHNFINESDEIQMTSESVGGTGILDDFFKRITTQQIVQTPSMIVKRQVYEEIGMFDSQLKWCEDWEMWARIGKNYKVGFIDDILAEYRIHSKSNTGQYALTGENITDLRKGIRIVNSYIESASERKESLKSANDFYAKYALQMASNLMKSKSTVYGARNQLRRALFMSSNLMTNYDIAKAYIRSYFAK